MGTGTLGSAEREDETDEIEKFNLFTHMSGKGFFCGALMKCVIKCNRQWRKYCTVNMRELRFWYALVHPTV